MFALKHHKMDKNLPIFSAHIPVICFDLKNNKSTKPRHIKKLCAIFSYMK